MQTGYANLKLISLLPKGVGLEIPILIKKCKKDGVQKTRTYRNNFGEVSYTIDPIFNSVYGRSPARAVMDYLQNHRDRRIREKFAFLEGNHFLGGPETRARKMEAAKLG